MKCFYLLCALTTLTVIKLVEANEIKSRSILPEIEEQIAIEEQGPFRRDLILKSIEQAIPQLNTPECIKDLNATLDGIRSGKPWAIASKYQFRPLKI